MEQEEEGKMNEFKKQYEPQGMKKVQITILLYLYKSDFIAIKDV